MRKKHNFGIQLETIMLHYFIEHLKPLYSTSIYLLEIFHLSYEFWGICNCWNVRTKITRLNHSPYVQLKTSKSKIVHIPLKPFHLLILIIDCWTSNVEFFGIDWVEIDLNSTSLSLCEMIKINKWSGLVVHTYD